MPKYGNILDWFLAGSGDFSAWSDFEDFVKGECENVLLHSLKLYLQPNNSYDYGKWCREILSSCVFIRKKFEKYGPFSKENTFKYLWVDNFQKHKDLDTSLNMVRKFSESTITKYAKRKVGDEEFYKFVTKAEALFRIVSEQLCTHEQFTLENIEEIVQATVLSE